MGARVGLKVGLVALVAALLTACGGGSEEWPMADEALAMAGADEWLQESSTRSDRADERLQVVNQGGPGGS